MGNNEIIEALRERLKRSLPGEKSHIKMIPRERRNQINPGNFYPEPMESSVLILLYPNRSDNFFNTIFIKRTSDNSVHSGQISFPGGKKDLQDISPVHTALREAEEEIGIQPQLVEVIGSLSPLYVSPSNFQIKPVIGFSDNPGILQPNPSEVEQILDVPLQNIDRNFAEIDLAVRGYTLKSVPCFNLDGHIIWGATAMILQELLDVMREIRSGV